jgi:hypothetical protein
MNRCKNLTLFVCPLALLLLSPPGLRAQSAPAAPFAPDSPELFLAFFQFQDDFGRWMDDRKASDAFAAQTLDAAAARELNLDPGDLGKLRAATQTVMADLKKIDKDYEAYANSRAKLEMFPEPAVLDQFAARRKQAGLDGIARLQKMLSAESWGALRDYVNNVHRLRYRRFAADVK